MLQYRRIMDTKTKYDAEALLTMPLEELVSTANKVRKKHIGDRFETCTILNARSGRCGEDCKFCAQSSKHQTDVSVYPLVEKQKIVAAAKEAKSIGAEKFGIVTSGNRLSQKEVDVIATAIRQIKNEIDIVVCGSLGALEISQLKMLKDAGLTRYHHNIETSRRFYPKIVSTHSFDQRIETVKAAREVGLEVCSGGIIGMGETWDDRIDMARTLKELDVDSVPINILVAIAGTSLEAIEPISTEDIIRTICIFRIILPDKAVKIAAGREAALKDSQVEGFRAGANGMLIGGYLTVKGASLKSDYALIEEVKRAWKE